jgi:hypothetical protein
MTNVIAGLAFNLVQYIRDNTLVDTNVFDLTVDGFLEDSKNECFNFIQSGGPPLGDFGNVENPSVQVIARGEDKTVVRSETFQIYDQLKANYALTFPEYNEDGLVYPAVEVAQISAVQPPGYIGTDDDGRHLYANNYNLFIGGSC